MIYSLITALCCNRFCSRNVGISSFTTTPDNHSSTFAKILSLFSLANINIVRYALVDVGFKDIHIEYFNVIFEFASAIDYVQFAKDIIVPIQDILANETSIRKEVILKMLAEEIDGKYVSFNKKIII